MFYLFFFPVKFRIVNEEQSSWGWPCNVQVEITWASLFSWLSFIPTSSIVTMAYSKYGILWKDKRGKALPERIQKRLTGFVRNKLKNGAIQ